MSVATPVRPSERVVSLDIIRGFALLGILVMNISSFSGSDLTFFADDSTTAWWDKAASYFRAVFFAGKFNSLFSLLFAVGFTMQLRRLEEKQPDEARAIYIRRLLVLLAFGWLHGCLFWSGDVLSYYAVLGFVLLLVRNWSDKAIAVAAAICIVYPGLRSAGLALFASDDWSAQRMAFFNTMIENSNRAYGEGTFVDAMTESTRLMLSGYSNLINFEFTVVAYVLFLATMLIGLLAGRHRWIENAREHKKRIVQIQWSALILGLVSAAIASYEQSFLDPGVPSMHWSIYRATYGLARVCIMVFYVATIVRLVEIPAWRKMLDPFAVAGRMPLTNYLMQTLIGTFIFYNWGLGFWGSTGAAMELALAFGIFFFVQVPLSYFWLSRYRYGPMEWLWRRLTYRSAASTSAL